MINIEGIRIGTPSGTLTISKIIDGVAYDQFNQPINRRAFRFQLNVLSKDWEHPKLDNAKETEIIQTIELAKA